MQTSRERRSLYCNQVESPSSWQKGKKKDLRKRGVGSTLRHPAGPKKEWMDSLLLSLFFLWLMDLCILSLAVLAASRADDVDIDEAEAHAFVGLPSVLYLVL